MELQKKKACVSYLILLFFGPGNYYGLKVQNALRVLRCCQRAGTFSNSAAFRSHPLSFAFQYHSMFAAITLLSNCYEVCNCFVVVSPQRISLGVCGDLKGLSNET